MRRTRIFALLLVAGTGAVACLDDSITGTRPLSMAVTANPQIALVDEVVIVSYQATGTGLLGIIMNWGDGVVDSLTFNGLAVEASGNFEHAYPVAGSFDIVGTAEAQNGTVSDSTAVQIN
ncbi:MAG: hypothetical protein O2958_09445 [Gemmatimonadetes bacterium]|nr:hypothetical protein [Gemmatimonadota bacterium]MDA1103534.1 hypothetical protein [Gemmatimonadota bacterium]